MPPLVPPGRRPPPGRPNPPGRPREPRRRSPTTFSTTLRDTQIVGEILLAEDPELRVTQAVGEILLAEDPHLYVSQAVIEVLFSVPPPPGEGPLGLLTLGVGK
jgi:hypothetical protein